MGRIGLTISRTTGVGGRLFSTVFFLVFLGMGLLFCVFIGREVYLGAKTYGWQRADCVILESRVEENGKGEKPYRFRVRYEYQWQGQTFSSEKSSRTERSFSGYEEAQRLAARYPLDSKAGCFVNPTNPSEALLERPSLWFGFFILLPLVFVGIGGIGIVAMWSRPTDTEPEATKARTKPISSVGTSRAGARFAVGFFALFLVIGVGAFYFITVRPLLNVLSARGWVATPCTIVSSRVQSHSSDDGTTYRVDILYRYDFDGREHRSSRFKFMGGSSSGYKGKAEIVRLHPAGAQRTCYVNPRNPAEAVLERGLTADMWFGAIPAVFVLVGAGGVFGTLRSKAKSRQPASSPVSVPIREIVGTRPVAFAMPSALEDFSGSRVLRPASSRLAGLIAIGIFGAIWNGVLWFLFLPDSGIFRRGSGGLFDWIHLLFMLPFLGVGFVLIGVVIYQWMALYNPKAEVTITPGFPRLGGRLDLVWRLTGRTEKLRNLEVVLEAREEATYRQGTRTSTDKKTFLKIEAASAQDAAAISEGRASVTLPVDTMPTFRSDNNRIIWSLIVKGEIPRWPDLKEEFVIEVQPEATLPTTLPPSA